MTPADLQRIRASTGWRLHRTEVFPDTSQGSVLVRGQRALRSAWRYRLLNAFALLVGVPTLRAVPAHGGARAQQIELSRLRKLAAAGVAVPPLLHAEEEFFVQRYVSGSRLDTLLREDSALLWWQRGLQSLVELHACGYYLSQAFARNFIAKGDRMLMIDFEDDPLEVMTLEHAQARDGLAYLQSSTRLLNRQRAAHHSALAGMLHDALAHEGAPVAGGGIWPSPSRRWR